MDESDEFFDQSIRLLELFPAKDTCEREFPDLDTPIEPLYGECVGVSEEGVVAISNLRLCTKTSKSVVNPAAAARVDSRC
jgi:hypothetical protein